MIRPHPADADLARYAAGELTREQLRERHTGLDLERSLDLHEQLGTLGAEPVTLPDWAAIAPSLADEPGPGRRPKRRAFALLLAGGLVVAPAVAEAVSPGSVRRTILDPVADVLPFVGDDSPDDTSPDDTGPDDTGPDDTGTSVDDGAPAPEPVQVTPDEPAPDDRSGDVRPDAEPDPPPTDQPADPPRDQPDPPPPDQPADPPRDQPPPADPPRDQPPPADPPRDEPPPADPPRDEPPPADPPRDEPPPTDQPADRRDDRPDVQPDDRQRDAP